jgi:hypothetical protein
MTREAVAVLLALLGACGEDATSRPASSDSMNAGGRPGTGISGALGKSTGGRAPAAGRAGASDAPAGFDSGDGGIEAGSGAGGAGEGGAGAGDGGAGDGGKNEAGRTELDAAGGAGAGGAPDGAPDVSFTIATKLASDVDPNAPTTVGIVTWSVNRPAITRAHIDFGLDTTYGMTAPVELGEQPHRTLLLGMKPARTYHFVVVAEEGVRTFVSSDHVIRTGAPVPAELTATPGFHVVNAAAREPGFIITSFWSGAGAQVPIVLDADGEVVWWYASGPPAIARARLSADGKNLWMTVPSVTTSPAGRPLQRVSMDTLDGEAYPSALTTHDVTPVHDDVMAYIDYDASTCASIFEIDPSGTTRLVFDSTPVVEPSTCHGNSVRYSAPRDEYTFSDADQDVFMIDRATGAVKWRLSEQVPGGNAAWGGRTHGTYLLSDSILIYANFGGPNYLASAIEYSLAGAELWRFDSGLNAAYMGDVQRLPGGNTLITHGPPSEIQEVDAMGNVVLTIDGEGRNFGYSEWRATLYGPPLDIQE